MNILVTGGAGFIGSRTTLALLKAQHDVVVLDNLCNSSAESLSRVAHLAGRAPRFVRGDIRDRDLLDQLLAEHAIETVLHFAGLKAVAESVAQPLAYYDNNVAGTLTLCQAMAKADVFTLVFSSSATVYGEPETIPIAETCPVGRPTNPYGRSKLMVKNVLRDLSRSDPRGTPNNLLPYSARVAGGGLLSELAVFGNDYPTPDGTGIRDYIHVVDLSEGYLLALEAMQTRTGAHLWNLGMEHGHSMQEMLRAFEVVSNRPVPYRIAPRRPGDIAICYADPNKAERELGWQARRGLPVMMADSWRWQSINPKGYGT